MVGWQKAGAGIERGGAGGEEGGEGRREGVLVTIPQQAEAGM